MEQHPQFDLRLHSDAELAAIIGSPIVERVTLHQWPLSCVQRITDADGRRQIYKAQSGPTVEDRFYAAARSPLLPQAETIYAHGGYVSLLLEHLEGRRLKAGALADDVVLRLGMDLLDQIADIKGDLPVYQVLGGTEWAAMKVEMAAKLRALVAEGLFSHVDDRAIATIVQTFSDRDVAGAIEGEIGLIHGDLTADNLIVLPTQTKLIDWQFVRRGPRLLDLALFLESFGIDPISHVGVGIMRLAALMRIHWLVECATTWFPPGAAAYDREIARLVGELVA